MLPAIVAAGVMHCASASTGPGSLRQGGNRGALCLLKAYDEHCRSADYTLSTFGVDTIHTELFRTARRNGACVVLVTESNRVVPQPPRVTGRAACVRVRRTAADVVADRCSPAGTISLTMLS